MIDIAEALSGAKFIYLPDIGETIEVIVVGREQDTVHVADSSGNIFTALLSELYRNADPTKAELEFAPLFWFPGYKNLRISSRGFLLVELGIPDPNSYSGDDMVGDVMIPFTTISSILLVNRVTGTDKLNDWKEIRVYYGNKFFILCPPPDKIGHLFKVLHTQWLYHCGFLAEPEGD